MHLTKSGFWRVLNIRTLARTKKHLLMKRAAVYGKLNDSDQQFNSIIMEYSDNGDLFQKISKQQKLQ